MGINISVRRPKGLNVDKFLDDCQYIVDVNVKKSWIQFHIGY